MAKGGKSHGKRRQVAALPYRRSPAGLEVLMVTSRQTRRWIIPKGWTMAGKSDARAAAIEAHEEAGVEGEVAGKPIGAYAYLKQLKNGAAQPCEVDIFPLRVTAELPHWREQAQRVRRWLPLDEAADAVNEPDLAEVIRTLPHRLDRG